MATKDKINLYKVEVSNHVKEVGRNLNIIVKDLIQRAEDHDKSKFEEPELSIFAENFSKLKEVEYNSDDYYKMLKKIKKAINNHYLKNEHHPDYFSQFEEWKEVNGYEGIYWVSNKGKVRNKNKEILRAPITPFGYARVSLWKSKSGKRGSGSEQKNFFIHRLVAEAFVENPKKLQLVNHIDGNKLNNNIKNLEWSTHSKNLIHTYENGLKDPSVKYVVKCLELDIVTEGCAKMEIELKSRGYSKASAAGIFESMYHNMNEKKQRKHLDLTFEGYKISELGDFGDMSNIGEMTIPGIIELLCDWVASVQRCKNGDIYKSIRINCERFKISPQLSKILVNTVDRYF